MLDIVLFFHQKSVAQINLCVRVKPQNYQQTNEQTNKLTNEQ